ncbi:MAG: hypothetical protein WBL21_03440 [Salinimicrobium sp.]
MIINVSEGFSEKKTEINAAVGKPFTLEERRKLQKTSLNGLYITAASIDIYNLLVLNDGNSKCSIEMRPKGIIISFKAKQDSFSLIVPYYKLKIYKGKAEEYSFYKDHYFIKVWAGPAETEIHGFIKKVRNFKADNAGPRIEDL